ncbi:MAG TPA: RNase adapter RapZ, partial [Longimicrobiales bacterium]|nr:RNase adapter RapZ [Longimicrobiales bacterium]
HLIQLFRAHFGAAPTAVTGLRGDGSNRKYYRLIGADTATAIGTVGPDHEENRTFLSYSRSLRGCGLPVPRIYAEDQDLGIWLQEDLGDTTLFDALLEAREHGDGSFPASILSLYRRVIEILPRIQVEGGRAVDFGLAYPRAAFDRQSIAWDLNYFKYHFLKLAHVPFNEATLEADFEVVTDFLLQADASHFLYRDFQSRNIMIREGEPWFIDYQGGRRGALQYDVASLLYDAKADIPAEARERLLAWYLEALSEYVTVDEERFRELLRGYILIRIMQALGAYGYRGFFERKPRFLQSVPYAARNLAAILNAGIPVRAPELENVLRRIADRWSGGDVDMPRPGLTVQVGSFSYRHGYPEDEGGHGGGFVFDCRGLPNPGRQAEYADRSGRDREVAEFIEAQEEARAYFGHAQALVDAQVAEYLRRGFTSLTVWFGCTGGQHRSVYMAERLGRHLSETFPQVHVRLRHREEPSWPASVPAGQVVGAG